MSAKKDPTIISSLAFLITKVVVLAPTIIGSMFAIFVKGKITAQKPIKKPIEEGLKATQYINLVWEASFI